MAKAPTPAVAALLAAGVDHALLEYPHDPRNHDFGAEAVAALTGGGDGAAGGGTGVVAGQILKTLVLALPKGLAVAVLPVPAKLSLKAAAAALDVPKIAMADPADAQRSSGYVLGGISPLGQRRRLPTVLDRSALGFDRVLFSAGRRGMSIALAPRDLISLTDAVLADIRAK